MHRTTARNARPIVGLTALDRSHLVRLPSIATVMVQYRKATTCARFETSAKIGPGTDMPCSVGGCLSFQSGRSRRTTPAQISEVVWRSRRDGRFLPMALAKRDPALKHGHGRCYRLFRCGSGTSNGLLGISWPIGGRRMALTGCAWLYRLCISRLGIVVSPVGRNAVSPDPPAMGMLVFCLRHMIPFLVSWLWLACSAFCGWSGRSMSSEAMHRCSATAFGVSRQRWTRDTSVRVRSTLLLSDHKRAFLRWRTLNILQY